MFKKKLFNLDVDDLEKARRSYKNGKFENAPTVVFLRSLLKDIARRVP